MFSRQDSEVFDNQLRDDDGKFGWILLTRP